MRRLDAALSNAPLTFYDVAENASGSRTKSAVEILAAKYAKKWKAVMKRMK